MIQGLVLTNNKILISQINEILVDLGEPNCKLVDPYEIDYENNLVRYLSEYTDQSTFMMSSDNILTIFNPVIDIKNQYKTITGYIEEVSTGEGENFN